VFGTTTNATVTNCIVTNNSAFYSGAGAYSVTMAGCVLDANLALGDGVSGSSGGDGGGAAHCYLRNCILRDNYAHGNGGGAHFSTLRTCAVTKNFAATGGGAYQGTLVNCTVS